MIKQRYQMGKLQHMKSKTIIFSAFMSLLLLTMLPLNPVSGQEFNSFQKSQIADSINLLIGNFAKYLDLSDEDGGSPSEQGKLEFIKLFGDRYNSATIPNFTFDPDSLSSLNIASLTPALYCDLITRFYEYVLYDEGVIFFNPAFIDKHNNVVYIAPGGQNQNRHETYHEYLENFMFRKQDGGYVTDVVFEISTYSGIYKRIRFTDADGNEDFMIKRPYSNDKIYLMAEVYFRDPGAGYQILNIQTGTIDKLGCFKYLSEKSRENIRNLINSVTENVIRTANVSNEFNKPTGADSTRFVNLFSTKTINTVDCNSFFLDSICDSIVTPQGYAKLVDSIYKEFYPLKETGKRDIKCVEITADYFFAEVVVTISKPRAKDYNDVWFKPDEKRIVINILVPFDTRINLSQSKDHAFSKGYVTHIGEKSGTLQLLADKRTGTFAYNVRYHHDYSWLPVDDGTLYKDFKSKPKISYNVSFSVNYFNEKTDKQLNWGVGAGLTYRSVRSEVKLDNFYDTIADYDHPVLHTIDLYKQGNDMKQSVKYSSLSIPLTGNLKYDFNEKTFLDIRVGIVTNLNFSGTMKQESGTATYKGYYEVVYGDNTVGKYLLEDIPEYGFTT
nr:hypothetical protein [Bacteroidota bacterium]